MLYGGEITLRKVREYRIFNHPIYYSDETWLNVGHTRNREWRDTSVTSSRAAFASGFTIESKNPSSKGKRLIITHIGNENGSVNGALWTFE